MLFSLNYTDVDMHNAPLYAAEKLLLDSLELKVGDNNISGGIVL